MQQLKICADLNLHSLLITFKIRSTDCNESLTQFCLEIQIDYIEFESNKVIIEKMKVLSHIFIFAYCVISCIIADENNLEVEEELHRWEEYKVKNYYLKII